MHASRNIRMCSKDCLCMFVCPTGATDTENGQIDFDKCIGCGACIEACPSHALSMVPDADSYPPQQRKDPKVLESLSALIDSKMEQERIARGIASSTDDPVERELATALVKSNRKMAEDLCREDGFMLPQSGNTHDFLGEMLERDWGEGFPRAAVEELLGLLKVND